MYKHYWHCTVSLSIHTLHLKNTYARPHIKIPILLNSLDLKHSRLTFKNELIRFISLAFTYYT